MPDYKMSTPEERAHLDTVRVERSITVDLETGTVAGWYGRHAEGEEPTESRAFAVELPDEERQRLWEIIVALAVEGKAVPAADRLEALPAKVGLLTGKR